MKYKEYEIEKLNIAVVDGDRGKNYPHQDELLDMGECVFLSANNVTQMGFKFDSVMFITKEKDNILRKGKLQRNDIVITTRGTIGNVAFYDDSVHFKDMRINSGMLIVRCFEGVDSEYLYNVFRSIRFQKQIKQIQTGTAQPQLPKSHFLKMKVILPPIHIQKKITSIIGSIDKKIKYNKKINDNLLEQAQTLYKSWFIDCAPFDGSKPSDWDCGTIDDLAKEIVCGKTPSTKVTEYYGSDIPFITIPDMHRNTYAVTTERCLSTLGANSQAKKMLPKNSICVSCIGTAGLVTLVASESQTNQQINSIIPKDDYSPFYIYLLMQTLSEVINKLGQSGSTIVNLNKAQFGKIQVTVPSVSSMKTFDNMVSPLFALILENQTENIHLSSLRETLLPKLMSGDIDVSDIQL
jgi:type I restriction enzyme S subunit